MGVFKGKRPGRQRGVTANVGTFKLSNAEIGDSSLAVTYWFDATSGDYTLSYGGQTTAAIAFDDAAAAVETAFELLSTITAVTVTGGGTHKNPFRITFVTPGSSLTPVTFTNSLVNAWQDSPRAS